MNKKGQVSVFVIIGVILVILVALWFVGTKEFGLLVPSVKFLGDKIQPLEKNIKDCVEKSVPYVETIIKQGGDTNPNRYVTYQNRKVKYLCYNIKNNDKCINMMLPFDVVLENINNKLDNDIKNCINKDLFKSTLAYDVQIKGEPKTKTTVEGDKLKVSVNYNVKLIKGEITQPLDKVEKIIDLPLKGLYDTTLDVVNEWAGNGFFDQLLYMLSKKGTYEIQVDKSPSLGNIGDIIYKINKKDNSYQFWFAVEGD